MNFNIEASDEAFEHLKPQRGALWDLGNERETWLIAYQQALRATLIAMMPYLPRIGAKPSVLDIGAGMGGIDLLLWRRYGDGTRLHLLDRRGGEPTCDAHGQPFGDLAATERFLEANGVSWDEVLPVDVDLMDDLAVAPFDVVISTQAWCFHFAPQPYLDWLEGNLNRGAVVITDVRHGKPEWLAELTEALGQPEVAHRGRKSDMLVFRP